MSRPTLSFWLAAISLLVLSNSATINLPSSFSLPVIYTVQAGYSVTYSSLFTNPDCWMFTLNHPFSAWSAYVSNTSQWVQVSSTKNEVWVAVITQGRPNFDQWVTEYRVSYTLDGTSWTYVDNAKLFKGNSNRNTQVRQFFSRGIYARAIRIHPTKWKNFVSMRFEALIIDS
jgi:hypothetical protein